MALGDRYLRSATAAAERLTGDRILRVAFAARPGAMAAFVGGQLAGAGEGLGSTGGRAPGAKIMRDEGKDTKLPANFLLAVTPTRIHVYKHRMGYGRVKIKGELGVFDREGLEVDVQEGKL
ncbi:MAG: hypothetical protein QOE36_3675, partial [Gaiellaceae bacterium]|nr:hypothetical protein [Gaiellaceae bacterium]